MSLLTKHDNGTLNLWQITFADKSKFSQVLSIGHKSRASGHRFRVNDITCHPVLPLLLTTSHHNIVDQKSQSNDNRVVSNFSGNLHYNIQFVSICMKNILGVHKESLTEVKSSIRITFEKENDAFLL